MSDNLLSLKKSENVTYIIERLVEDPEKNKKYFYEYIEYKAEK